MIYQYIVGLSISHLPTIEIIGFNGGSASRLLNVSRRECYKNLVMEHLQNKCITFSGAFLQREHSELMVGSILDKLSFKYKKLFKILY